jgi:hypothetical protein
MSLKNIKKMNLVKAQDCWFRAFSTRHRTNVFACSFWIGSEGYARTLLKSLEWWGEYFPQLDVKEQWNVRFYIDYGVDLNMVVERKWKFTHSLRDVFEWLLTKPHMELWFYDCPAARRNPSSQHFKTFGSLLRLHALTDRTTKVVAIRNIEALTCTEDLQIIEEFTHKGSAEPRYQFEVGTAFQHSLAHQYMKTQKFSGICLCSFTAIKQVGTQLFAWPDVIRAAGIWNEFKTSRDRWMFGFIPDFQDRSMYGYGVDEFVILVLLWPRMKHNPEAIFPRGRIEEIGEYISRICPVTDKRLDSFIRRFATRHSSGPEFWQNEMKRILDFKGVWTPGRCQNAFKSHGATALIFRLVNQSYLFASELVKFFRRHSPMPKNKAEDKVMQSLERQSKEKGWALLFDEFESETAKSVSEVTPKRLKQLKFLASIGWRDPLALSLPGWTFKNKYGANPYEQPRDNFLRDQFILAS